MVNINDVALENDPKNMVDNDSKIWSIGGKRNHRTSIIQKYCQY